jgi:soluble lytic murein transglycosylase-like protein
MRKKFDYRFDKGLPGGANQVKGRVKGSVTQTGYKRNSPDVNNDFNIIPSPYITMVGVDFPVYGEDNLGNGQMMYPGNEYMFPGDYVTELPAFGKGGLKQWFAEKWVDVKTGKECGRSGKDKNGRPYPACRPSRRVNETTPKTTSEMSASEKAKFKRKKTSGKRIDYNHKRAQYGGRQGDVFQEVDTYIKPGQRIQPNWAQSPVSVTNYTFGKNLVDDEPRFSLGLQGTDILDEIKYRADAIGSIGIGVGNRKGKSFRPAGENLRAGLRGQASWQGVPGNAIENLFGRRSGLDWRGSFEGEAGLAYANGAVRPYMSVMPQTNVFLNDNLSLGIGYEMRGRYDKNFDEPVYGNTDTGSIAPISQRDGYSGMGRGAARFSLNYDLGNGDFIEGYYAKPDPLYQGSMPGVREMLALESEQPRFGVRLRKSFKQGGQLPKAQQGKKIADVANQMVLNGEDGTRPPLNIIDNMVALFDEDGVCRDNTCVNVVKDIYNRAGYNVIPEGVYNNRAFKDDYDSYGLQLVAPQNKGRYILDDLQPGDIIQYRHDSNSGGALGKEGYPFHLGVYTENGQYVSDGSKDDPIKKQSVFYYDDGTSKPPFDVFRLKQLGGSIPKAQGGIYTVRPGDTFNGIANSTGIGQEALRVANPGIDYNKIQVGQVLAAPGLMGPQTPPVEAQTKTKKKKTTGNLSFNDLLYRQAYQESKFNPNAKSPKGYKGFTQIGSGIMQDYAKATGDTRTNPYDPDYAIAVQKWAMDKYLNNTGWIKGSDKVKQAKALAAYNWGPGNTLKYLNAQKEKGTDIYADDLSWVSGMPKETRDYIDHILGLEYPTKDKWEANFQRDTTDSPYSKYYKQQGGETLYDYVKGLGYSPTFANRKKIFADYFDTEYTGTAKQNIELLNQLKSGKLNINEYAQRADVQPVREAVIQQPALAPQPSVSSEAVRGTVMNPTPAPETTAEPVSSYRGATSLTTDDDLQKIRDGVVRRAYDVISGKEAPYRLPSNIANAPSMEGKNPDNFTCIGGVCSLYKDEGVLDQVITSNTEFARTAYNSGFSRKSTRLENLKPGDVIQHYGRNNNEGTPIPTHAQMFLGLDDDGNYLFFDNYERTASRAPSDNKRDALRTYSPEKMQSFVEKGKAGKLNGVAFYHLNKEDAYDPEEQVRRARAQANKQRRLPGELYIDEQYDGKDYDQEIQSSQDVPYIYRGKKDGSDFENDLVGLFNNSEMDERMKSTFGITEQTLNDIKPIVYGIISQESNMDRGARFEGAEGLLDKTRKRGRQIKYKLENIIAPTGVGDLSYGPGSVRWSGLRRGAKKQIGKRKNMTTPEGSYFAIVDLLLQSANLGERYVGEDLNPDLLDKNPWYPALYAYNGQMSGSRKGKTWGLKKGYTFDGSSYSADPGSYPDKVQGYANQLQRFVPIDWEPTPDNYYDPRFVPVVKPKAK